MILGTVLGLSTELLRERPEWGRGLVVVVAMVTAFLSVLANLR